MRWVACWVTTGRFFGVCRHADAALLHDATEVTEVVLLLLLLLHEVVVKSCCCNVLLSYPYRGTWDVGCRIVVIGQPESRTRDERLFRFGL